MKKSLLALAAIMSVGAIPAQAATIRIDENTFANTGLKLQIWGQHLGKTHKYKQDGTCPGQCRNYTDFSIQNARIYFSGQVHKHVQFGANLDFGVHGGSAGRGNHQGNTYARATDAFINLTASDELQLMAGLYRLPFSRATLTDSYTYNIPTGYGYAIERNGTGYTTPRNYYVPFTIGSNIGNAYRDAGITLWGNVADGMFQYRIGVFDGRWDHVNTTFGKKDNLAYSVRVQFTPTMLGYKGEKSWSLRDTYLGRQDVLTIGLGYNTQKWDNNAGRSGTAKAWAVDAMWEQKFGTIVPNLQLGYQDMKDVPNSAGTMKLKFRTYYAQGQLLYDQVVGIGKPALAYRYEKQDDRNANNLDVSRHGLFVNYYIKGQDAKIQFGFDHVLPKKKLVDNVKKFTDVTLALQMQF